MNQEIKNRWTEKLRSGKYEQGVGYLREKPYSKNKYCCLGVLCEIAVEDGIIDAPTLCGGSGIFYYDGSTEILPNKVARWAGLENNPLVQSLASFNDGSARFNIRQHNFLEIADIIEERL